MPIAFVILNWRCQVNSPAKSAKTAKNHRKIGITMLYHWDNPNPTVQSCPGWLICIGHHICTSVSEAYQKRRVKMKAKSSLPAKIAKAYCWWNFKNFFCEIGWRDIDSEAFFRNYMLDLYILDPYHGADRWERPSCGGGYILWLLFCCAELQHLLSRLWVHLDISPKCYDISVNRMWWWIHLHHVCIDIVLFFVLGVVRWQLFRWSKTLPQWRKLRRSQHPWLRILCLMRPMHIETDTSRLNIIIIDVIHHQDHGSYIVEWHSWRDHDAFESNFSCLQQRCQRCQPLMYAFLGWLCIKNVQRRIELFSPKLVDMGFRPWRLRLLRWLVENQFPS